MLQKIIENAEAVIALLAALWALWEKLKGNGLSKALKLMVGWSDHVLAQGENGKLKEGLAVAQEAASVRKIIVPVMKEVRQERLKCKELTIGVDIDERGKPTAKAAFGWRF